MTAQVSRFPETLPNPDEIELAKESSRVLAAVIGKGEAAKIRVIDGEQDIIVPVSAMRMLVDILAHMSEGESVAIIPSEAELTTQQAADFLNVSRPFFVKLLEEGKIEFHKVGSHRRVNFKDLLAYKQQSKIERRRALDELTAIAQESGVDY